MVLTEVNEAMDPLEESLEKFAEACLRVISRYMHGCDARSVSQLKEQIEATLSLLQFSSQYLRELAAKVDTLPSPRENLSSPETDTWSLPAADTQPLRRVTLPSNQEIQDSMLPDSLDRRRGEEIDAAVDAAAASEEDPWFRAEEARHRYPPPRVHKMGYDVFDRRRTQGEFWPRGSVR
ncbi:hypothetical protein ASPACDRAFT_44951 [Aspergillus aculeatus ATCC 16872]|uniref:Uncharacterized protein n=1 Tax=Aspergillus aculeatus (strain ATCC 16872 / CBS 172.66 / WB 5094) TaxID=690307 RepID=A0A1L9WQK9_ASPA1|nr:uncharacterized protein ASPACDRAFT_44951 [Aspergillus aculeatus ATCC 16872]OJJ98442.1 hypothetical protein ASPACDRAFT_44951 [Aspergillus aculeatus ATCC 16872]